MSTRNISWGVGAAGSQGLQPYHLRLPIVLKSGNLILLETKGFVQPCTRIALPLMYWSHLTLIFLVPILWIYQRGWMLCLKVSASVSGYAAVQLIEALRYKPKGRGFDPSGCSVGLGSTQPLNRNEYLGYLVGVKGGRCVRLTILPPSCADCLEILRASTYWSPKLLPRPVIGIPSAFCTKFSGSSHSPHEHCRTPFLLNVIKRQLPATEGKTTCFNN
jgi:hypothetical protein